MQKTWKSSPYIEGQEVFSIYRISGGHVHIDETKRYFPYKKHLQVLFPIQKTWKSFPYVKNLEAFSQVIEDFEVFSIYRRPGCFLYLQKTWRSYPYIEDQEVFQIYRRSGGFLHLLKTSRSSPYIEVFLHVAFLYIEDLQVLPMQISPKGLFHLWNNWRSWPCTENLDIFDVVKTQRSSLSRSS